MNIDAGEVYIAYLFKYAQPPFKDLNKLTVYSYAPGITLDITQYYAENKLPIDSKFNMTKFLGTLDSATGLVLVQGVAPDGSAIYENMRLEGAPSNARYVVVDNQTAEEMYRIAGMP